jgi:hypothetical protein
VIGSFNERLDILVLDAEALLLARVSVFNDLLLEEDGGLLGQLSIPPESKRRGIWYVVDLVRI